MSDDRKFTTRPKDSHGSWVVRWTGKHNEVPILESSNWAPGYTDAHRETQAEALAAAMAKVTAEIAVMRQKWIALTMIIEQNREGLQSEMHDQVSDMIAGTPGITVPEAYTPKVRQRIYDTQEARDERIKQIVKGYNAQHDDQHGLDHLERIRDSYAGREGDQVKADAMQLAIDDWKHRNQNAAAYDDHQDH